MFGNGNPFVGLEGLFFAGGADNSPALGDAYKGVYAALNWTGFSANLRGNLDRRGATGKPDCVSIDPMRYRG